MRELGARIAVNSRLLGRALASDAAGSWILNDPAPSLKQVWAADHAAHIPAGYPPLTVWCRIWRYPAVVAAAALDGTKWLLIHPLRGPLTLAAVAAAITAIYLT